MALKTPVILIVEDDADTRDVLGRVLSFAGYAVRFATNGWEALLALEESVDLILLDMMLPGMDGVVFLRTLRADAGCAKLPVVVITAMEPAEVEPKVRPYGVEAVLTKGGTMYGDLKAVLMRTLAKPRPHARVNLPEPGRLIRPYLDVYLKMLAWA
jgi:CheY-like chemotaxis protein